MKKTKRRVSRKTYEGIISSDRVPAQLKKGWEKKIKRKGYGYLREGDRQIPKYEIFGMAILIILAFSIVFLRIVPTAQVVGVGEEYSSEILSIGQMLTATYSQELVVIGELNSLKLSGYMQEGTQANIYLVSSGGQQLIADSNSILSEGQIESQDNETFIRTFSDICADTCEVSLESGEYTIQVEVLEGELYLENANYVVYTNIGSSVLEEIEELENKTEQVGKKEKVSKEEKTEEKQEKKEEKVEVKEEKAAAKEEESEILEENVIVGEIVEEISEPIEVLDENVEEETTLQYEAVIGQPVKWKKRIVLITADDNVSITLPDLAEKIIIKDENNETVTQATIEGISVADSEFSGISGAALIDKGDYLGESLYWLGKFLRDLVNSGVGFVVYEENPFLDDGDIDIIVEELVEHVEIEYETPAPQAEETQTEKGKQVVVSSQVDYSNVLTFAEIPNTEVETIKLYWSENSTLPRREVTSDPQVNLQMYDTDGDNLVDYLEWNTPHTSNQTFEIELTILNVQSYPVVGDNWTVQFNTTGVANLTIAAFNGTSWSQNATVEDLEFLELRCGEELVNYTWVDGEVRVENYTCNETSGENSQVLTTGSHHINFTFGDQSASAHNWAYSRSQAQAALYLPMDEGTGSVTYDVSGKGNDGTLISAAATFDGVNDYVYVADNAGLRFDSGTQDFTVELWMRRNQTGIEYFIDKRDANNDGYTFGFGSSDRFFMSIDNNDTKTDIVIIDTNWHHLVAVVDRSDKVKLYVDGVEGTYNSQPIITGDAMATTTELAIGTVSYTVLAAPFNGTIDEVRIYNRSLSASEVSQHYRGTFSNETGLVLYQNFNVTDVTNATVLYDKSGEGNNGTFYDDNLTYHNTTGRFNWAGTGYSGDGLSFNGWDDYISIPDSSSVSITGDVSLGAWINMEQLPSTTGYDFTILSKWGASADDEQDYVLFVDESEGDRLVFRFSNGGTWIVDNITYFECETNFTAADVGRWVHVFVTVDVSDPSATFYIDGVAQTDAVLYANVTSIHDGTGPLTVGTLRTSSTAYKKSFNGDIDEVLMYNYSLTEEEVEHLYRGYDPNEGQYGQQFGMDSSVVAYFPFDESNVTNPIDYSDLLNNGTKMAGVSSSSTEPASVTGKFGNGLVFDGTDDWVNTSVTANLSNGSFSVFAWVKDVPSGNAYVMAQPRQLDPSYASDWILGYINGGLWIRAQNIDGGNVISDGDWHYTGFTFNGTDAFLYIDGIYVGTNTTGPIGAVGSVNIMTRGDATSVFEDGKIDEVLILNRSLSAGEILNLYKGLPINYQPYYQNQSETQSLVNSADTLLYLTMDEAQGGIVYDNSSQLLNGTMVNYTNNDTAHTLETAFPGFRGLDFDMVSQQHVDFGDTTVFDGATELTISAWIKKIDTSADAIVAKYAWTGGSQRSFRMTTKTDGFIELGIWKDGGSTNWKAINSSTAITVNQWHHVVGTWNGTSDSYNVYIDGENVTNLLTISGDAPVSIPNVATNLFIGAQDNGVSSHFNGSIDEFLMFNRSLTPAEVLSLYNGSTYYSESMGCTFSDSQTLSEDLNCTGSVLTINSGGNLITNGYDVYATNLTINSGGVFNSSVGGTVTVTDITTVGGNFTAGSSTLSLGSGVTSDYALIMNSGSTFNGGSGTHTIGSIAGTPATSFTLSSGTTTIDSARSSTDISFSIPASGFDDGDGTVIFTMAGTQLLYQNTNTARTLYNVILNKASGTVQYYNGKGFALTVDNDLTITSGTFDTEETVSGTDHDLTVAGDVDVTGTLDGNAGAMSFGSLTINSGGTYNATSGTTTITSEAGSGYSINHDGTFTHNNGLVVLSSTTASEIDIAGSGTLYDLTVSPTSSITFEGTATVGNDLTVTTGTFAQSSPGNALTVTGDVLVSGGQLGNAAWTGAGNFGSLTINSGGTYYATNGTTTITSETTGDYAFDNDGVYTHNSGTLTITTSTDTSVDLKGSGADKINILILNNSGSTVTWTNDHSASIIDDDLKIYNTTFVPDAAARGFIIDDRIDIYSGGTFGGTDMSDTIDCDDLYINSGGTYNATTGNTTVGGEMYRSGTFNHNDGTVVRQQSSGDWDGFSSASSAFYNLINEGGYTADGNSMWVINSLYTPSAGSYNLYYASTLTLGNDTQSGSVSGSVVSDFTLNLKYPNTLRGANEAYPAQIIKHYMGGNSAGTGYLTLNNTVFTLTLDTGGNTNTGGVKIYGNSTFADLTIDSPNKVYTYGDQIIIKGVDINSGGTFDTRGSAYLEISGEHSSSRAIDCAGTFYGAGNTIEFTSATTTAIDLVCSGGNLENMILDMSVGGNDYVEMLGGITLDGNLTVDDGVMYTQSYDKDITVVGDVLINSGGNLGRTTSESGSFSFGSLTINSGGTYNATNGTTTITSRSASLDGIDAKTGSTFTHNSGTVNMTGSPGVRFLDMQGGDSFYNLIQDSSSESSANYAIVVDNDLTVTTGELTLKSTGTVTGDVDVSGTLDGADASFAMTFGSLTINSGGTYEATSGTTTVTGSFDNDGTFTHNEGTMLSQTETSEFSWFFGDAVLYNLQTDLGSGDRMLAKESVTVINQITRSGSGMIRTTGLNLILGNTSQSGTLNHASFQIRSGGGTNYIQGASLLYPGIISVAPSYIDENLNLKWIDLQATWTTSGTGDTITLYGDCEFDAFTVSSGDTLDLNGQRAEFGGLLTGSSGSAIDYGIDGLILASDFDLDGTMSGTALATILTGANEFDMNAAGLTGVRMTNIGDGNSATALGLDVTTSSLMFVSGEIDLGSGVNAITSNLTIVNGGTLDGGARTITVSENWKSSGGLIGKSALDLDGSEYVSVGDDASLDIVENITIEAWINARILNDDYHRIVHKNNAYTFNLNVTGSTIIFHNYGSSYQSDAQSNVLTVGKWHHVVLTKDTANGITFYVDGKNVGTDTSANAKANFGSSEVDVYIGIDEDESARGLNGTIARVSIYNTSLTQADIRNIMFDDCASMDNQSNLVSCYQFDEGSGTTVADSIGSNTGTASASTVWASGGTFTMGTSTVNMTGTGTITYIEALDVYNLEVAQSGQTTTTEPLITTGSPNNLDINNLLTVSGGTFNELANTDVIIRGNVSPIVTGSSDLSGVNRTAYATGYSNITSTTYSRLQSTGVLRYLLGNIIVNDDLELAASGDLSSAGYNITTENVSVVAGLTLNLTGDSVLTFEDTSGAGFGTSAGTLNIIDSRITGGSSNSYDFDANMTILLDNATIENFSSPFRIAIGDVLTTTNSVTIDGNYTLEGIHEAGSSIIAVSGDWNSTVGTFTYGTSTVNLTSASAVNATGMTGVYNLEVPSATSFGLDMGNLSVYGNATIAGDVTVGSSQILNMSTGNLASFGSLTINSLGVYHATSGTTTITNASEYGVYVNGGTYIGNAGVLNISSVQTGYMGMYVNGGTYTHGDETFICHGLDFSGTSVCVRENGATVQLYNLNITGSANTLEYVDAVNVTNDFYIGSGSTFKTYMTACNAGVDSNNLTVIGDVILDGTLDANCILTDNNIIEFGTLEINSGGVYSASNSTTTISGNLTNSGTFTNNSGVVLFDGASSYVTNETDLNNVTVSGNLTLLAEANYTQMNVTSTGNLTYNANHTDDNVSYYKAPSGFIGLTGNSILNSTYPLFNDSQILDNTTGTVYLLDTVGSGSTWFVQGWNQAPVLSSVEMIPSSPRNSQALQIDVICYDEDAADNVTAYWDLYNNSEVVSGLTGSGSVTNNTSTTLTVAASSYTTTGQVWIAEVWCGDGTANTSKTNATAVTIIADPSTDSSVSTGGYAKTAVGQFVIDPMEITAPLPRKGFKVYEFIITSESDEDIDIEIDTSKSNDHVSVTDNEFTISGQRSNKIKVTILAGTQLGTSAGKLIFRSDIKIITVPIIVEVESERVIFDSKIDVSPMDKLTKAGDTLTTHITLLPVGPRERIVDAIVKYTIRDLDNNILYTESETFAVDEQKSYDKEIPIPNDLPAGSYIVNMDVLYENSFATSSSLFEVEEEVDQVSDDSNRLILIILVIIIPLALYLLVSAVKRFRK